MGKDFIPEADSDAAAWMRTFARRLLDDPARYMTPPSDAATVGAAVQEFRDALAVATNENTRVKASVARKNIARVSAEQLIRLHAALLKRNAGISDSDKVAIGIPPMHNARSTRHAPSSQPVLEIRGARTAMHDLCFHDANTPTRRAMPFGATHLQVFVAVGERAVSDPAEAKFCGCFTRSRFTVKHDAVDAGKVATYFGRWTSQRGEFGPWSAGVSMTVAA